MIKLLRIPERSRSIEELLGVAAKLDLDNVLLLSQRQDGGLVFLEYPSMTVAEANWLADRFKTLLLIPGAYERKDP